MFITDRITSSYLKAFKKAQSFPDDLQESVLFEHFVNYCIVSKEYNAQFLLEIVFPKKIALPEVSGVQEAYIGILPALEYLKLITDLFLFF